MKGLTWSSLRKHYSLMPLFAILGFGVCLSAGYVFRLATRNPDVSWRKKANPEPWQEYSDKQYKFYRTRELDTNRIKEERPTF